MFPHGPLAWGQEFGWLGCGGWFDKGMAGTARATLRQSRAMCEEVWLRLPRRLRLLAMTVNCVGDGGRGLKNEGRFCNMVAWRGR
ncbi:MAG: hypothetical protein JXD22_14720 [Sedimentisphaerales bacterium]|nr:hypothetical protein [Sedimentisphaerales bacterium]